MLSKKLAGYFGFAAKARKLQTGYNTCLLLMEKRKVCLLVVCEDASDNTKEKLCHKAEMTQTECRIFGSSEELSHITGRRGNMVFAVTDRNFANVIKQEIDMTE